VGRGVDLEHRAAVGAGDFEGRIGVGFGHTAVRRVSVSQGRGKPVGRSLEARSLAKRDERVRATGTAWESAGMSMFPSR
jgi:hypothetical protein